MREKRRQMTRRSERDMFQVEMGRNQKTELKQADMAQPKCSHCKHKNQTHRGVSKH